MEIELAGIRFLLTMKENNNMKFNITIDSDDDTCNSRSDISYMLHYIACRLNNGKQEQEIRDRNHNVIGKWEMIEDTYQVLDTQYHGDSPIQEVVFGGTKDQCISFMREKNDDVRFYIIKDNW